MSATGYKALGFLVWKLGLWYMRRRYGALGRRVGAGALTALALGGAAALAQRRGEHAA